MFYNLNNYLKILVLKKLKQWSLFCLTLISEENLKMNNSLDFYFSKTSSYQGNIGYNFIVIYRMYSYYIFFI